jgi:hypothetical protein
MLENHTPSESSITPQIDDTRGNNRGDIDEKSTENAARHLVIEEISVETNEAAPPKPPVSEAAPLEVNPITGEWVSLFAFYIEHFGH